MTESECQIGLNHKIDVEELIKPYKVMNIDAFETYLTGVWKDLANRSENKNMGINKVTFAKYYELPGIIFDRLFHIFDVKGTEYLDLYSFIDGMLTLFTKEFDDLVKFIFHFYDFDKDGKISKDDIRIVLSYVPLDRSKIKTDEKENEFEEIIESQEALHKTLDTIFKDKEKIDEKEFINIVENVNSDIFLFILIFLLEKRPFNDQTIMLLENIKKSPKIPLSPSSSKLICSPSLNSIFQPSSTIANSPSFRRLKSQDIEEVTDVGYMKLDLKQEKTSILLKLAGKNLSKPKPRARPNFKPNATGVKKENKKDVPKESEPKKNLQPTSSQTSKDSQNESQVGHKLVLPMRKSKLSEDGGKSREIKIDEDLAIQPAIKCEEANSIGSNENGDKLTFEKNNDSDSESDGELLDEEKTDATGSYSGYMYKMIHKKILKKVWFVLICKDLYYYKSKEETKHQLMHNLSGVFLQEEGETEIEGKKYYSFSIVMAHRKEKKYFVDDKKEYEEWVYNIKKAIGYSDLNELYEVKEKLGNSSTGIVRLGINKKTGKKVAIKIMGKKYLSPYNLGQVKTNIEILKIGNHPNIGKLYDVYENNNYIYLIMEYCEGGDLFSYLEERNFKIKEERAAQIIQQLSAVIYFLHEYGIVHCDLTTENILMTDKTDTANIKLLNFSSARFLGPKEYCNIFFGTLSYISPEVLQKKPSNKKVDLWGIGVIAYALLSGFLPFDSENSKEEIMQQTINDPVSFPESSWGNISAEAKGFVENLLNKDPEKRMDIKEVIEHPWLQKFSLGKMYSSKENVSGGMEFKIYSSPSLSPNREEYEQKCKDDFMLRTGFEASPVEEMKETRSSVKKMSVNVLTVPLANLNLPIFSKKLEDIKQCQ